MALTPCSPAGTPFIILNSMTTALMAYGLVGLRNDPSAIFIFMSIISLQALVSNQFLVTCVWLTPTAVRSWFWVAGFLCSVCDQIT